jgi:hypothetical protein
VVSAVALVWLVGVRIQSGMENWRELSARPPVYGLWDVETVMSGTDAANGNGLGENAMWRRVGTSGRGRGNALIVQLANGDVRHFALEEDATRRTWKIRQRNTEIATLQYDPQPDGLVRLTGLLGTHQVQMSLRRVDPAQFQLLDLR